MANAAIPATRFAVCAPVSLCAPDAAGAVTLTNAASSSVITPVPARRRGRSNPFELLPCRSSGSAITQDFYGLIAKKWQFARTVGRFTKPALRVAYDHRRHLRVRAKHPGKDRVVGPRSGGHLCRIRPLDPPCPGEAAQT